MTNSRSAVLALVVAGGLRAAPCTAVLSDYQGYRVGRVRITSPADFFHAAGHAFDRIAASLPLQPGAPFDLARYNAGTSRITASAQARSSALSLRLAAAAGTVENCDDIARTLDVRYIVYTTNIPLLNGRSFEDRQEQVERPSTAGAGLLSAGRLLAVPLLGYNQTRGLYSGLRLRSHAIDVSAAASANSFTGTASLAAGPWRLTAVRRDLPAGDARLVESTLAAAYLGSFLIFHYGASLETGTRGAGESSPFGGLKLFTAASGHRASGAWTAGYGIELASPFLKHIVDLGYTVSLVPSPRTPEERPRFIGAPHHPLTLELRLGAGIIRPFGSVPLAGRFFGGNRKLPFLEGSPWDLRGQPYFRGLPENRLGGGGGTRFYALNWTLAKAVYARPLIPRELGTRDFVSSLDFALQTAKGQLSDAYMAKDPALPSDAKALDAVEAVLNDLKPRLAPGPAASDLSRALRTVTSIRGGSPLAEALAGAILPRLEARLADPVMRASLGAARAALAESISGPTREAARKRAGARAARDLSSAEKALDTLLYELNICSIAPVAIFDAARVWPSSDAARFAAGAGIRLSLVNLNLTMGYSASLRPRPGTPRGALFLELDVTDLFH